MPAFDTPQPLAVSVELGAGDVRIVASERADTTVEVRPSDPAKRSDVAAAEQTVVDCAAGTLLIRATRRGGLRHTLLGPGRESVDLEIALPSGSSLRVDAGLATVRCAGSLGECDIKTGAGEILIDAAGPLRVRTGAGSITVERARGRLEARTGTGTIRIGVVEGLAVIRNAAGDTWVGEATGSVQVHSSFGKVSVDRAHAGVTAKTAYGDIDVGEVASGAILALTGYGGVQVGVRTGVLAWLDLQAQHGVVHNELEATGPPGRGEATVEVCGRSSFGDITVRRSQKSERGLTPSSAGSRPR